MRNLDPQVTCPCGSGRLGAACCVVDIAPVTGIAVGFDSIRMSMEGVQLARLGIGRYMSFAAPMPEKLSLTTTLKNPHQFDEDVEVVMGLLQALLESPRKPRFDEKEAGRVWQSLEDNLYAARYHQRQYLFRHRLVHERTLEAAMSGSKQIELIFSDVPLRSELEAVVLRSRSTLDTVGNIGMACFKQKGGKFGAFYHFAQSSRRTGKRADQLRVVCAAHEKWLEDGKNLRDAIAHGGHMHNFRGVKAAVAGIDPARLERDDASEYVLSMWSNLLRFVTDIFKGLQESG
jgi:hypothetical protein